MLGNRQAAASGIYQIPSHDVHPAAGAVGERGHQSAARSPPSGHCTEVSGLILRKAIQDSPILVDELRNSGALVIENVGVEAVLLV